MIKEPEVEGDDASSISQLRLELQERDDILAMAAHELRNPLHALSMQLALARSTAESHAQPDTAARIKKAESTLARYIDRVTVLMDLMRGHAADYPLSVRPFDLSDTLRALVESFAPEAKFRGVTISTELPDACPAVSDPLVVEQVVDNLILNALKHSGCSDVVVRLRCAVDRAQIDVQDNGRGIAPDDQQRIFSKSIVARQGQRGSGTGLGLWIVRKLLAAIGGDITLHSQPSSGSIFRLELPMIYSLAKP